MKTKEIPFSTIEQIKRNNKLSEQLQTIENIMEDIYYNYRDVDKLNIDQFKKDVTDYGEDEDFESDYNSESFIYSIMKFVEINQRLLTENSKNLVK